MNERQTVMLVNGEEISILLQDVNNRYGYDFSNYSIASIKRRIHRIMMYDKVPSFAKLRFKILDNEEYFNHFLEEITVNVTEMYRDPLFYKTLRKELLPQLNTYPHIRIWHAGCSTGEEVYSLAILLYEEGLLDRSLIYATDINQTVLVKARSAEYPISTIKQYTKNYIKSGGKQDFSMHYTTRYGKALFNKELRRRIVFSLHNLVTDQSFNEFNLVVCRNVLIYFNRVLQNKVVGLFSDSLSMFGYLALGNRESIAFTDHKHHYKAIDQKQRIWQKIK